MNRYLIALISLSTYCLAAGAEETPFLNEKQKNIIFHPETVMAYRLESMKMTPVSMQMNSAWTHSYMSTGDPQEFGSFREAHEGFRLNDSQISILTGAISDTGAYHSTLQTDCPFRPGVGLQFIKGGEIVKVLFCFSCDEWAFEQGDQRLVYADMGNNRKKLLELAKNLFPHNREIQAIPERTEPHV